MYNHVFLIIFQNNAIIGSKFNINYSFTTRKRLYYVIRLVFNELRLTKIKNNTL